MRDVLGNQIRKIPQLEAEVADLKQVNSLHLKIHQADVESHRDEV